MSATQNDLVTFSSKEDVIAAEENLAALLASSDYDAAIPVARSLAAFFERRSPPKAGEYLVQALEAMEGRDGTKESEAYLVTLLDLAFVRMAERKVAACEELLAEAGAIEKAIDMVPSLVALPSARVKLAQGQFEDALGVLEDAVAEQEELETNQQVELDEIYAILAMVRTRSDPDDASAEGLMDKSIDWAKATEGESSTAVAEAYAKKGMFMAKHKGNLPAAIAAFQEAVNIFHATESPQILQVGQMLVSMLVSSGDFNGAADVVVKLLSVIQNKLGDDHPMVAQLTASLDAFRRGEMPQHVGHGHGHGAPRPKPCCAHKAQNGQCSSGGGPAAPSTPAQEEGLCVIS